jgi:hypothetical protein
MENAGLHRQAVDRFELVQEMERGQRALAVEDMAFAHAEEGQWEEGVVAKRKDRPRFTINRIAGSIDQLVGDQRQNRTSIDVLPGTGADRKLADTYTGLIRAIEVESKAENAYDAAYLEAVTCGFGGFRVETDYSDDDAFEQNIRIAPIRSAATSLYFDPDAVQYDRRDARWAFVITSYTKAAFKERFPDAAALDFETEQYRANGWVSGGTVRVAEYWYKEPVKRRLALLSDGRVIDAEEEATVLDELMLQGVRVVRERTADSHKVKMCVVSGAEVLEGPTDWAGKFIPLVPVFGKEAQVEGRRYCRGLVRFAKDAQRVYNYATSAVVEASALAPKDPYFATPTQLVGHTEQWDNLNVDNPPVLLYTPDPLAPGPPSRGGAPQVQAALIEQARQAGTDIHATTGLEPASLGNVPELKSGKAIEAQQAMGDRGAFIFQDNLQKSIGYCGEILVDLIPRIYDTERTVRVLGADGSGEDVTVNQEVIDRQTGAPVLVNDLSQGKYSVAVSTGPAFRTQRERSLDKLLRFLEVAPEVRGFALDLVAENMDVVNNQELKRRVRKFMVQGGVVEPTAEEAEGMGLDQQPAPDPMQEALVENVRIQTEELISRIENREADTVQKLAAIQEKRMGQLVDYMGALLAKVKDVGTLSPQDLDILQAQQAVVEEGQLAAIEGEAQEREVQRALAQTGATQMEPPEPPRPQEVLPVQNPQGPQGPRPPGVLS